jgi:hypothetical protein
MPSAVSHPHDLPAEDFTLAMATAARPDLLRQLVETSRRAFGFYTLHFQHTINYPWAAACLERLPRGSRILEIGAGVNPLPLFLAEREIFVDCVDKSPIVRTLPAADDWNEWGFFDYSKLHPNLTSYHCDITQFVPSGVYDAIYSVCSMAHMPRTDREEALRLCGEWLCPEGDLFLAFDLIPSTDFIWNRSEGVEVEPPLRHGSIDDVVRDLAAVGFDIEESRIIRHVPKARTDLLHLKCRLLPATSVRDRFATALALKVRQIRDLILGPA